MLTCTCNLIAGVYNLVIGVCWIVLSFILSRKEKIVICKFIFFIVVI